MADYADEHGWETFGYGTLSKKAVEGWQNFTGSTDSTADKASAKAKQLGKQAEGQYQNVKAEAEKKAGEANAKAQSAKSEVQSRTRTAAKEVSNKTDEARQAVLDAGHSAAERATALKDKAVAATQEATEKAKLLASDAKARVAEATSAIPFNFSDGIEGIVREAEKALGRGEVKVEDAVERVKDAASPSTTGGPRVLLDMQRPRELRPETVTPQKPTFEGKEKYSGPPLPLGFEPPPGYYIPGPPSTIKEKVEEKVQEVKQTLPLLVPTVKEFAAGEPIISQLASTIDSLTASLSTPTTSPSADAFGILSKAQDDLSALNNRLSEVKKAEKEHLEKTLAEKTKDFEALLQTRDAERAQSEAGLKSEWVKERQAMVDDWNKNMESELESQRGGIEKRLVHLATQVNCSHV